MDAEIRAAERAGDQALVRRLRRRAGAGVQVGDTIKCVSAKIKIVMPLVGKTGTVMQVMRVPERSNAEIRVCFPGYRWNWTGRGGSRPPSDPWDDGLLDLGWWLMQGEYEVVEQED